LRVSKTLLGFWDRVSANFTLELIVLLPLPPEKLVCKKSFSARHQWLTPVILATEESEIRRIKDQSQPRQIVHKSLS
jgi:hypothetical protein